MNWISDPHPSPWHLLVLQYIATSKETAGDLKGHMSYPSENDKLLWLKLTFAVITIITKVCCQLSPSNMGKQWDEGQARKKRAKNQHSSGHLNSEQIYIIVVVNLS